MIEKTNAGIEQTNRRIEKMKLMNINTVICVGTSPCIEEMNVMSVITKRTMAHAIMIELAMMLRTARTMLAFLGGWSFCC